MRTNSRRGATASGSLGRLLSSLSTRQISFTSKWQWQCRRCHWHWQCCNFLLILLHNNPPSKDQSQLARPATPAQGCSEHIRREDYIVHHRITNHGPHILNSSMAFSETEEDKDAEGALLWGSSYPLSWRAIRGHRGLSVSGKQEANGVCHFLRVLLVFTPHLCLFLFQTSCYDFYGLCLTCSDFVSSTITRTCSLSSTPRSVNNVPHRTALLLL